MDIGQHAQEVAPPAGVEPTTYRLGGGRPNTHRLIDPKGISASPCPILSHNSIDDFCRISDVLQPLLDTSRRAYHREYHRRTAPRRKLLRECRYWCRWLRANLEWPAEPVLIIPVTRPLRRPLLRLPR
jgi:hypothetical protein